VGILWDALLELDELSSSTNSIMELMGTLLSSTLPLHSPTHQTPSSPAPNVQAVGYSNMHILVPRLWPFLGHTIRSVRKSTLDALLTLLGLKDSSSPPEQECGVKVHEAGWLRVVLRTLLCQVFQRFALEGEPDIRKLLHKVSDERREELLTSYVAMGLFPSP
jgi:TATA-binding protein-associated factor